METSYLVRLVNHGQDISVQRSHLPLFSRYDIYFRLYLLSCYFQYGTYRKAKYDGCISLSPLVTFSLLRRSFLSKNSSMYNTVPLYTNFISVVYTLLLEFYCIISLGNLNLIPILLISCDFIECVSSLYCFAPCTIIIPLLLLLSSFSSFLFRILSFG